MDLKSAVQNFPFFSPRNLKNLKIYMQQNNFYFFLLF